MILFFYGDDSYRIHGQVKKLKEKFISASLGDTNLAIIDPKITSYSDIVRQILAMPFLSKTRLVIIENIMSAGSKDLQEKIGEFIKKTPSSTVLVFSETKADKRLSLFKKLMKVDKVQEFKLLDDIQLRRWIKSEVEARGGNIDSIAINKLIEYIGNDLWRISNEIDKLIAFDKNIAIANIELLVRSKVDSDIFKMIDAISQKNLKTALQEYQNLLSAGENELYLLSMIVYQYRNLIVLKDMQERTKSSNPWDLAKKTGVHPYVTRNLVSLLGKFELEELKQNYQTLLDYDGALKTGKMESKAGITLLIVKLIEMSAAV